MIEQRRVRDDCRCRCGKDVVWIDTDKWGRCPFDAEPKKVIITDIGKQWVCVPPSGHITRAIINTGLCVGNTLAYIPHFYSCKARRIDR